MKNLDIYRLSKRASLRIKGGGTKALEEEFGTIILSNGYQVTIAQLEEEFGIDIQTIYDLQRAIARANNLMH